MVIRLRFRRWLLQTIKMFGPCYVLVIMLIFISPTIQLNRTLEEMLFAIFIDKSLLWIWSIPLFFLVTNGVWISIQFLRQWWVNYQIATKGTVRILLPKVDAKTGAGDAVQFWNQVSDLIPKYQHITFELAGSNLSVNFALCADAGANRALIMQALADWPGTQSRLVAIQEDDPLHIPEEQTAVQIVLRPKYHNRPILTSVSDVLAAPLVEIARLPDGVKGGVLLLVRGDNLTKQKLGKAAAKETSRKATDQSLEQKRSVKATDTRAQRIFLEVRLVVWAAAGTKEMAQSVVRSLARSVKAQYESSNPLQQVAELEKPPQRVFPLFAGRPWTDAELATLAHLEGQMGAAIAPQLETAPARPLPPSPECRIPRGMRTVLVLAEEGGAE